MISDKDISIVVQGPIIYRSAFDITEHTTRLVCQRLKKLFPHSELILSTWMGENVEGIPHDRLILNDDPGATWFNYGNHELLNNCNRLIVSTFAGVKAATRPYVLKVRSDLLLISPKFLKYFYQYPLFDKRYKFVKNRILAFSIYSIKGHKTCLFTMQRPFHISDWAYFGYKEDLLDLYDIPLTEEPHFSQWFLTRCKPFFDMEPHRLWKMPPEQYVTHSFLKKHMAIHLEHTVDTSHNNMAVSARVLVNNFLVLDQTQFSMVSLKYLNFQLLFEPVLSRTAIFFSTWLHDYCRYTATVPLRGKIKYFLQIGVRKLFYRLANFILRAIDSKKNNIGFLVAFVIKKRQKNHYNLVDKTMDNSL